jgi:hypothetical protein
MINATLGAAAGQSPIERESGAEYRRKRSLG